MEKRILIRTEAGMGDIFVFGRFIKLLKDLGATTIVMVHYPFLKTFMDHCMRYEARGYFSSSLTGYIDRLVTTKTPPTEFSDADYDYDVAMMSLPRYVAYDTSNKRAVLRSCSLEEIPCFGKYIFGNPEKVAEWKAKLPTDTFKIGICWKASPLPGGVTRRLERDMPLAFLAQLGNIKGVTLYNLLAGFDEPIHQKDVTSDLKPDKYLNIVPDNAPKVHSFLNFDKAVGPLAAIGGSFMDTAALMENLDLIVSVDTAAPNLSGAMYRPTFILLPYEADWRWGNDRLAVSPWHPTARLFWQSSQNDWASIMPSVIHAVEHEVAKWRSSH